MESITIYLAGEVHSSWRQQLRDLVAERGVNVNFVGPQEEHDRSDSVGEDILGQQPTPRFRDLVGAGVNSLRTRVLMRRADMTVAYFGDKYKQWNTAADAGASVAAGIPLLLVLSGSRARAEGVDAMAVHGRDAGTGRRGYRVRVRVTS